MRRFGVLCLLLSTAVLCLVAAPKASAWPKAPGVLSKRCVPQKALSPALKRKAKVLLGGPVCVPRIKGHIELQVPATVQATYAKGQIWCIAVNTSPGAAWGEILSMLSATRFCGKEGRGWAYVALH
jgi:hypothetical protein